MNKQGLINAVALKGEMSKKDAEKAIDTVFEVIMETNAQGEDVKLIGVGTFMVKERAERTGRNPQTKEEITIPATRVPYLKVGKSYKERIQNS